MTQRPNGSIFALAVAVPCGLVAAAIALWAMSAGGFLALVAGAVVGGIVFWLLARGDATIAHGTAPPDSAAQADTVPDAPEPGAAAATPGAAAVAPAEPEPEPAPEYDPVPDPAPMPKPTPEAVEAAGEEARTDGGNTTGQSTKPEMLRAPRDGGADDLKQIKGVGPKLEQLLNSMGVYHFDQIAGWTADEVAWLDDNLQGFKGRVSRDDWVAQAQVLAQGGATEFSDKVKKGDVY
jgi:predicted flap endonuclease-1-like 5' DNA nuclease